MCAGTITSESNAADYSEALAVSLEQKRQCLAEIVRRLGPEATAGQIRHAAIGENLGSVDARILGDVRNSIFPHRKRDRRARRHPTVEVGAGATPHCPFCNSSESRVTLALRENDGRVRRQRKCKICIKRFDSLESAYSADTLHEKRREASKTISEKRCSGCGFILSVTAFAKKDADLYASRCRTCQNARRAETQLEANLQKFGLSMLQYESLLDSQQRKCGICGLENQNHSHGESRSPLVFDHCHKTGRFRGLICTRCNRAMGMLRDDAEIVEKALNYLRRSEGGA